MTDDALRTLFLPFAQGQLAWPKDEALFLRARTGASLRDYAAGKRLICEQTFKPDADALQRAGLQLIGDGDNARTYALTLLLPPRQREESRALLARAVAATHRGGRVVACGANNEGARSIESDLAQLVGPVAALSKHKCRVCWSAPLDDAINAPLVEEWRALDAVRPILDGRFVSRPGVFAWDRIDPASALLAQHLPSTLAGRAADLGAGYGYLSVELLSRCPNIAALDVYEAERRALDLARQNLARFAARTPVELHWHDVTAGLPRTYNVIVMNPPFHAQQRIDRPDIGRRFIAAAALALAPGGSLWLVANRHLPYEAELREGFGAVRAVAQERGYKIIEARKAG